MSTAEARWIIKQSRGFIAAACGLGGVGDVCVHCALASPVSFKRDQTQVRPKYPSAPADSTNGDLCSSTAQRTTIAILPQIWRTILEVRPGEKNGLSYKIIIYKLRTRYGPCPSHAGWRLRVKEWILLGVSSVDSYCKLACISMTPASIQWSYV